MTRGPGFVDENGDAPSMPVDAAESARPMAPLPQGPKLFDVEAGTINTPGGKIGNEWDLRPIAQTPSGPSSVGWMAIGISVLVGSWILLSLADFVLEQFRQAAWIGGVTLALFTLGFALMGVGVTREIQAWKNLRHVEMLRRILRQTETSADKLRAEVLPWVHDVRRYVPAADEAAAAITSAKTSLEIVSILRGQVISPLRRAAVRAGTRAALEGGALIALIPTPALEGAIAGVRSLMLIRRVAKIYGIRPSFAVTILLLQRTAWTVASVASVDALRQAVFERTLHNIPGLKHIFAAMPETSVAALRLYRLATVVSVTCSPIWDEIGSVD